MSAYAKDGLRSYQWKARLLIVLAPAESDASLAAQRDLLRAQEAGLRERDLIVIEIVGDRASRAGVDGTAVRRERAGTSDAFAAILVGKDGGTKLRSATPVPPDRLFAVIDGMPMRQRERAHRQAP